MSDRAVVKACLVERLHDFFGRPALLPLGDGKGQR
jgi:hypothetical protein